MSMIELQNEDKYMYN